MPEVLDVLPVVRQGLGEWGLEGILSSRDERQEVGWMNRME